MNGRDPTGLDTVAEVVVTAAKPEQDATSTDEGFADADRANLQSDINALQAGQENGRDPNGEKPQNTQVAAADTAKQPNHGCPAGTTFVADVQVGEANAAAEAGMPTVPTRGKLGMEPSGNYTSPASVELRAMTGNARFGPLRGITGTSSIGGSIGRAIPFFGLILVVLDALVDAQQQTQTPQAQQPSGGTCVASA